jgi:tetratricopeptide (TPR) repeat protein
LGITIALSGVFHTVHAQSPQKFIFQKTAEDYFVEGLLYGDDILVNIELARTAFTQAIRLNPNYAQAYFYRGNVGKDEQEAIKDYTEAIRLNPNYAEAYLRRGEARYALGDKQKAIEDYTQVIKIAPTYTEAYYQRGLVHDEVGNRQAAIEDYIQVIRLDPADKAYWRDNERAIRDYSEVMRLNPDFALAYYQGVASFYQSLYGQGEAMKGLNQAIDLNPSFADVYYFRGRAHFRIEEQRFGSEGGGNVPEEDKQQAIADFTQAIQLNSNFAEAYYWRGLARLGRLNHSVNGPVAVPDFTQAIHAIPDFTQATQLNPEYTDAYYQRGLAYSRVGNEQGAIQDFIQALRLAPGTDAKVAENFIQLLQNSPDSADTYYQRGLVRLKLEDYWGAFRDFSQAIRLKPNFADAYYYRGLSKRGLFNNRDFLGSNSSSREADATADFTKAIRLNPNFVDAYFDRGFIIFRESRAARTKQIIEDMTQVLQFNPNTAEAYYIRGYVRPGKSLLKDYTQAIRLNPRFAHTYDKMGYSSCSGSEVEPENSTLVPQFNPDFASGHYFNKAESIYGLVQLELSLARRAIETHTRSIQLNARNIDAYYARGLALLQLGEVQRAIQDFTQALQLNSQDADAYYSRGLAHHRQKDYRRALEDYTEAIRFNPDFADAYLMKGLARYDLGDKQGAFEDANQAIRLDPSFTSAYFIRARVRNELDDRGGADEEDYGDGTGFWFGADQQCGGGGALGGSNPVIYYNRGRVLARRGDKNCALENLRQAAALFQAQGNLARYREIQNLINRLRQ